MKTTIKMELEKIRAKNGGLLRPKDIVKYAQNPKTALYKKFEWNDEKAGDEFRLWQAREIIMLHITVVEGISKPVRTYISLMQDRTKESGGYRHISHILGNKRLRESMLNEAFAELDRVLVRYNLLTELVPVFEALELVRKRSKKKSKAG